MRFLILVLLIVAWLYNSPTEIYHYEWKKPTNQKIDLPQLSKITSRSTLPRAYQKVSWYSVGLRHPEAFTAACWNEIPKGTKFKITYLGAAILVTCNDRGHFKEMGRFLDLSRGAFSALAPLSTGIITAEIERI